jgi:hypothetical protein
MVLLDYFIWKLDLLSFDVRRVPGILRMKPGRIKAAFVRGYGFRYPVGAMALSKKRRASVPVPSDSEHTIDRVVRFA